MIIIDNEQTNREALRGAIDWRSIGVTIVAVASTGEEALVKLLAFEPDIALADIAAPRINSIELARKAREAGLRTQFIVVASHEDYEYARRALRLGVTDFIMRPCHDDEVKAVVRRAIERSWRRPVPQGFITEPESKIVREVVEVLEEHYGEDLTVGDLAERLSISPGLLSRRFQNETGVSIKGYLTEVRIEESKRLLRDTYDLIYQIAHHVGYADPKHFSRLFLRQTGMHPQEYRDSLR